MNLPEFSSHLSGKRKVKTGQGQDSALRQPRDERELRVEQRTAELDKAGAGLQAEMQDWFTRKFGGGRAVRLRLKEESPPSG